MKRLYEIDLLRIIAAVAVVIFHYTFSGGMQGLVPVTFPGLGEVSRYGYLGVDLFFAISGFVVLLSAWDRSPREFVISRIVRLYPAFWVAVTLTTIFCVLSGKFAVGPWQYLANLTMLNPVVNVPNIDVVYWTLWAEIRFYFVVFALACAGLTRRRVLLALWGWLGLTAAVELGLTPSVADLLVQSTFSHYFIAGMALCLVYRFGITWELGAIVALAYANAVYRGLDFASGVAERYRTGFHPAVTVGAITVIFTVVLLVALKTTTSLGRPWFSVAGSLTYPLYLIHAYIGFVLLAWLGPALKLDPALKWILLMGLVAGMGALAHGIHVLVERPVAPRLKSILNRVARVPNPRRAPAEPETQTHPERSGPALPPPSP